MLRTRLLGAVGALLLSLGSLSAQSSGGDSTPDCLTGRARGAWDLPVKDEPGKARGILADLAGHRLAFEARLTPAPLPGTLRGGRIDGLLTPITRDGLGPRPIAEVHGTWVVGPDGRGRFESVIVELEHAAGERPDVLGKFAGYFADPLVDGRDPVGRFVGRWAICR
jgi:hypothetical protein